MAVLTLAPDELQQRPAILRWLLLRHCELRACPRQRRHRSHGAAGHPRGHEATPCFRPARVFVPNPPETRKRGRLARLSRSRLLALGGLDPLARGGLEDLLIE